MRQRIPYATCGNAARNAFAAAVRWNGEPWDADPGLKPKTLTLEHWKVLAAVVSLTATYSKLDDYVFTAQVAEIAGVHIKNAQQRLRDLHHARIIDYRGGGARPGGGRGYKSYIGLPQAEGEPTGAALLEAGRGADLDEKGSLVGPKHPLEGEPLRAALPRRNPEKNPETRARGACECEHAVDIHGHAEDCPLAKEERP